MTARNSFELGQARYYHRPDAPAHIEKGCPHDVPSVTTILNALAKPALVPWAAGAVAREAIAAMRSDFEDGTWDAVSHWASADGGKWSSNDEMFERGRRYLSQAPARIRDTAADMGTLVHACADALAKGEPLPPLPDGVSQAEVEAFVEQFERWREGYGATYLDSEVEVHNRTEGYAGRYDGRVQLPDGERVLLDVKSGKAVYDVVAMQLAAYGQGWAWAGEWQKLSIDRYAVLHLRPDGFRFLRIDVTEDDYAAFLATKRLWSWQQAAKGREWAEIALPVMA